MWYQLVPLITGHGNFNSLVQIVFQTIFLTVKLLLFAKVIVKIYGSKQDIEEIFTYPYSLIHCSIIFNSQGVEANQMSINR